LDEIGQLAAVGNHQQHRQYKSNKRGSGAKKSGTEQIKTAVNQQVYQ
jgi:hypothetical protein